MFVMAVDEVKAALREMQDNLLCPICLEIITNPSVTLCTHVFCQECITRVITSSKRPKCPLCKSSISRRALRSDQKLDQIAGAVKNLIVAVAMDTGNQGTPLDLRTLPPPQQQEEVTGTPGILLHSKLHPTPHKPNK